MGYATYRTGRAFTRGSNASPCSRHTDPGPCRATPYSTGSSRSLVSPSPSSCAPGVGYDYGAELGNCAGGSFPRKNGQRYRLHLDLNQRPLGYENTRARSLVFRGVSATVIIVHPGRGFWSLSLHRVPWSSIVFRLVRPDIWWIAYAPAREEPHVGDRFSLSGWSPPPTTTDTSKAPLGGQPRASRCRMVFYRMGDLPSTPCSGQRH